MILVSFYGFLMMLSPFMTLPTRSEQELCIIAFAAMHALGKTLDSSGIDTFAIDTLTVAHTLLQLCVGYMVARHTSEE